MKKTKYVVISNKEPLGLEWEASLQETMAICHTLSKAYEIGLFLSGITAPNIKYRKVLETIKRRGAARVDSLKNEPAFTIVTTKIY
jgi:hypothetical protein